MGSRAGGTRAAGGTLSGRESGPPAARAGLGAVLTPAGQRLPLGTRAAGNSPPEAPRSPRCLCLFCVYGLRQAPCQSFTCPSPCGPRHNPMRERLWSAPFHSHGP